jgi:predicted dehydrogenase
MTKVAIIGLGRMGMLHLMNCLKLDDVEVVAAADSSKKGVAKARALKIKNVYEDYHEIFNHPADLDAVVLSLPNFMHFESIKLSLEAGLNVFAEKPLATSVGECQEIVRLVQKSGKQLMVGHAMRFVEALMKMKENLEKGHIGDLEVATIEEIINGPFSHPRVPAPVSDWWFDPKKSGGGALLDVGYHMIDLFRFFAGDAEVVYSYLNYKLNLPVEDGAILVLRSDSSVKGIINIGWYQQTVFPKYNFRTILHGTAGYHMIDLFRFFAGDAEVVYSYLNYKLNLPVEDGAILVLRSDSSVKGIINIGWYQQTVFPKYNFRTILHGTAGYLSSEDLVPHNLYVHAVKEGSKNILRRLAGRKIRFLYYTYYYESFYKEMVHFFDCVKNGSTPLVSAEDGLKTVEIIQAAYDKFRSESSSNYGDVV